MSKSAVMVFSKNSVEGAWKLGEHKLPKVSYYRPILPPPYSILGLITESNNSLRALKVDIPITNNGMQLVYFFPTTIL